MKETDEEEENRKVIREGVQKLNHKNGNKGSYSRKQEVALCQ